MCSFTRASAFSSASTRESLLSRSPFTSVSAFSARSLKPLSSFKKSATFPAFNSSSSFTRSSSAAFSDLRARASWQHAWSGRHPLIAWPPSSMRERTRRGVVGTSRTHREMVRAHGDRSNGTENICGPKSSGHSAVPPLGSRSSRGPLLRHPETSVSDRSHDILPEYPTESLLNGGELFRVHGLLFQGGKFALNRFLLFYLAA